MAAYFGKLHFNVMRDINELHMSDEFRDLNFEAYKFTAPNSLRSYDGYRMTKDGFTRLVMSYNGKKAGMFIEAYIQRFNEMEASLKASQPDLFTGHLPKTLPEALRMAADAMEKRDRLERGNKVLKNDNIMLIGKVEETEAELNVAKETIGKHDHQLTKFVRMLDGVNSMKVQKTLRSMKYLKAGY